MLLRLSPERKGDRLLKMKFFQIVGLFSCLAGLLAWFGGEAWPPLLRTVASSRKGLGERLLAPRLPSGTGCLGHGFYLEQVVLGCVLGSLASL